MIASESPYSTYTYASADVCCNSRDQSSLSVTQEPFSFAFFGSYPGNYSLRRPLEK